MFDNESNKFKRINNICGKNENNKTLHEDCEKHNFSIS